MEREEEGGDVEVEGDTPREPPLVRPGAGAGEADPQRPRNPPSGDDDDDDDDDDEDDVDGQGEGTPAEPPRPQTSPPSSSSAKGRKGPRGARRGSPGKKLSMGSVVKVFVVRAKVNYKMPWQRKAPKNSNGSGFTIDHRRILTNAHVVEDATTIMVRRHGHPKRYVARVLCIGYQCDIALLEVSDDAFWVGCTPLSFGDVPHLQDSVTCVGYPTGGDNISVTCGVVSRVDVQVFVNRFTSLLAVQIDAAINAGNSGGPVFQGKKVVGIAFSRRLRAQNIGHIIPVPVVQRFLSEFEKRGRVTFIEAGITIAKMESPTLRKYYGMKDEHCGVLIVQLNPLSSLAYCNQHDVLKVEDVLMEIDGVPIADDGTISFRGDERIGAEHLFGMKYAGDKCQLKVLREKGVLVLETVLQPTIALVPKLHGFDSSASYFIVGGLVFCPLSVPFLRGWYGSAWQVKTPSSLLWHHTHGLPSRTPPEEGPEQIVILAQILASPVTVGYRAGGWCVRLKKFNDVPIRNMKQLVNLVEGSISRHRASKRSERSPVQEDGSGEEDRAGEQEEKENLDWKAPQESETIDSTALIVPGSLELPITKPEVTADSCDESPTAEPTAPYAPPSVEPAFLRFDVGERNYVIVLDTEEVVREEANILATHFIAQAKSPDLHR